MLLLIAVCGNKYDDKVKVSVILHYSIDVSEQDPIKRLNQGNRRDPDALQEQFSQVPKTYALAVNTQQMFT